MRRAPRACVRVCVYVRARDCHSDKCYLLLILWGVGDGEVYLPKQLLLQRIWQTTRSITIHSLAEI